MDKLTVEAEVDNLDDVLRFVVENLASAGCPAKLRTQVMVAAEEVFVNIARYAYDTPGGTASVRVSVDGGDAVIEFEDGGKPYNPVEKEDPDITACAERREVGGLGIFMVKKLMDSMEYRRDGGSNVLTLRKRLTP